MKTIARYFIGKTRVPLRAVFSLFFERKFLRGRFFDEDVVGFLWCARAVWQRNILRLGRPLPFPAGLTAFVSNPEHIEFHPDDLNNFQSAGTYLQNFSGRIRLGHGCYIGPNVGIITSNHDPRQPAMHQPPQDVEIGDGCWLGMNCVVLPGVTLGPGTVVAAGAVVTRSVPEGRCVLAGVPAKVVKRFDAERPGRVTGGTGQ